MKCKYCGGTDPNKMMNKGQGKLDPHRCKTCHNEMTKERGKRNKETYTQYKGGKCEKCGYDDCIDALDFHHVDPEKKDISFRSIRYWGLEKAKKELDNCKLLCCRCHRELHAGLWDC